MKPDELSDELKEKVMAAETPDELIALAGENGFELSDEVLDDIAGGTITVRKRLVRSDDPSCRRRLMVVNCVFEG